MDERDFLALAQSLVLGPTQAYWRTGVSRAYYAAFHVARRLMENLRFKVPRADRAHSYLWLRLMNCGEPQIQRAASDLNDLRRVRNLADYDLIVPLRQNVAQAHAQLALAIISVLDNSIGPAHAQITAEMRRYERDVLREVTWQP